LGSAKTQNLPANHFAWKHDCYLTALAWGTFQLEGALQIFRPCFHIGDAYPIPFRSGIKPFAVVRNFKVKLLVLKANFDAGNNGLRVLDNIV
jgi:hypothetical protein